MFFYGDSLHQKVAGRSSPTPIITPTVSMATGGQPSRERFFEGNARAGPIPSQPRSRPAPVEGAARALPHELGSNSGSTGLKRRVAWRWHSSTDPKYITIQRFLSSTAAHRAAA